MFYLSLLLLLNYSYLCTAMDTPGSSMPTNSALSTLSEHTIFNLDENQINKLADENLAIAYKIASNKYADQRLAASPNINDTRQVRRDLYKELSTRKDQDKINSMLYNLQNDQSDDEQEDQFKDEPWMGPYERSKKGLQIQQENDAKITSIKKEMQNDEKNIADYEAQILGLITQLNKLETNKALALTQKNQKDEVINRITEINHILKKSCSANEITVRKKLVNLDKQISLNTVALNKIESKINNLRAKLQNAANIELSKKLSAKIDEKDALKAVLDNQMKQKAKIEFRLGKINEPRLTVTEKIASGAWSFLGYKNNQ